jgi:hypothetical protein
MRQSFAKWDINGLWGMLDEFVIIFRLEIASNERRRFTIGALAPIKTPRAQWRQRSISIPHSVLLPTPE